ncbi:hypothetical protein V2G26_013616 [Clonostachys chloroleuca]|uniref:TMEM205-like domain-containing protein n=1 Tax=Clonostachys chloroleuca TaxID=1926264 RepID=A0AA35Q6I9_9HYPO|nr:unnamed protein product [Clonostachys chloroleuca]
MAGSILFSAAPYHIIAYGTLLGTSFWHSFIVGPVMFKTVERPVFSAVQSGLFPTYFGLQTAIPVVLALSFPGNTLLGISTGVSGLLHESHRLGSLLPITTAFLSGFVNFVVLLPTVNKVMKQRQGQAKRDGKEWYAEGPHSEEMRALTKKFGMLHGISSLLNLTTFLSALVYGFTLGSRIQPLAE